MRKEASFRKTGTGTLENISHPMESNQSILEIILVSKLGVEETRQELKMKNGYNLFTFKF